MVIVASGCIMEPTPGAENVCFHGCGRAEAQEANTSSILDALHTHKQTPLNPTDRSPDQLPRGQVSRLQDTQAQWKEAGFHCG